MSRYPFPFLLIILLGATLAPLLLHPTCLLYPRTGQATDLTITHWPAVAFNVRTLREQGQIPLWRTTIAGGGPWLANPQSWLLYPPAWLFFLLPIGLTFNLLLLSHLLLAALATYAFGRRALGLEPPGAALAGLAFVLTPWLSGQLAAGHINIALALAWLPVALLGAQRAAGSGQADGALLTGVAWAAALLNHIQMAAFIAMLSVGWYLFQARTLKLWQSLRACLKTTKDTKSTEEIRVIQRFFVFLRVLSGGLFRLALRVLLITSAVALLLSAALLIPLAEALPHLNRSALTAEEAGLFSLSWSQLLTALIPTYGGEPEQVVYLGLPAIVLAVVGLAVWRDRTRWFFLAAGLLAALFALGNNGPLFPLLFRLVPGLDRLRVPPRAWALVAFSLALLAGRGLDALLDDPLRRRSTQIGLAALILGLALAGGFYFLHHFPPIAVGSLALFATACAALFLLRARGRIRPGPCALAFLLLVTADLSLVRAAWTTMRSPAEAFAWGAEVAQFLAGQPGRFRVYSPSYSLPQHTAVEYGLSLADGVDPFQLRSYADFLALAGGYERRGYSVTLPPRLDEADARPDAVRLGLLNVGYVASAFPLAAEGLTLQTQIGGTYLYRNERELPRAFVVSRSTCGEQAEEGITLSRPIQAAPAQIVSYTPNRVVVEVAASEPSLLVLSEVWYPGWQATADGSPVPIRRVEGVLRGVCLEAGRHTVEFRYSPWTVWAGLAVSGLTALLLLAWALVRRRKCV